MNQKPKVKLYEKVVIIPWEIINDDRPIEKKFLEFNRKNPDVYWMLVNLAMELKKSGHNKYGMKGLFEVLRWQKTVQTKGSEFKINNNYAPIYARVIMYNVPPLAGFFNIRTSSPQVIE